jgi:hypothetical protein
MPEQKLELCMTDQSPDGYRAKKYIAGRRNSYLLATNNRHESALSCNSSKPQQTNLGSEKVWNAHQRDDGRPASEKNTIRRFVKAKVMTGRTSLPTIAR